VWEDCRGAVTMSTRSGEAALGQCKAVHHLHRDGQGSIYLAAILNWNSLAVLTPRAMPPVLARTHRRVQLAHTPALKIILTITPQCFRSLPVETRDGRLD
jgi:hypothetical protein